VFTDNNNELGLLKCMYVQIPLSIEGAFVTSDFNIHEINIKLKAKASHSYTARLTGTKPEQPRFTIIGSGS